MNTIYLSTGVNPLFHSYILGLGYQIALVLDSPSLSCGIASHPDLFICKMGSNPDSPVFYGNSLVPKDPYPQDIPYNAVCTGKYFIHLLAATDADLLRTAKEMEMILINVRQGYTKCNTVVVDENSLITSDQGIFDILSGYPDIHCLLIEPGYVNLPGYPTGFIGGASGRVGDQILFHGNLKLHPDYARMKQFIKARGLKTLFFEDFPLTDIGSIIESNRWAK